MLGTENLTIFDCLYEDYKINKPIRLIELFGGVGSQSMALRNIGANFEHYRLVEYNKFPVASYNAIHKTEFVPVDITKTHASDLGIIEQDKFTYLLTYSFPCQDLSLAGKQRGMTKGSGTRSGLLWEVERLLDECDELPQVLLMENVPDVIGKKNIKDFQQWENKLQKLGYSNFIQILNAKDYGIPQNRGRCFMVSILGEHNYTFPKPIELNLRLKDMLEDEVDDKYYLSDKMLNYFTGVSRKNKDSQLDRNAMFQRSLINTNKKGIANTITTAAGQRANDNFIIEPICLNSKVNGISTAITTVQKDSLIYSNLRIRKLTPLECWRLMGFKDEDYNAASKVNSNAQLYKQAGNSIVVNVLEAIIKQLF